MLAMARRIQEGPPQVRDDFAHCYLYYGLLDPDSYVVLEQIHESALVLERSVNCMYM